VGNSYDTGKQSGRRASTRDAKGMNERMKRVTSQRQDTSCERKTHNEGEGKGMNE
jgi:hypothetical protein